MKAFTACAALLAAAAATFTLSAQETTETRERVRRVVVYGTDPCPPSTGDEIVVCARRPETDRYRIPEELRDSTTIDDPASRAWASEAKSLEFVGRTGIQSCSPSGSGGASGCWDEIVRQWRAERDAGLVVQPPPEP